MEYPGLISVYAYWLCHKQLSVAIEDASQCCFQLAYAAGLVQPIWQAKSKRQLQAQMRRLLELCETVNDPELRRSAYVLEALLLKEFSDDIPTREA